MFHKRLMKEFQSARKEALLMTAFQWVALMANLCMTGVIAWYLEQIHQGTVTGQRTLGCLFVLAAVLVVRSLAARAEDKVSFRVSSNVKKTLRERIFGKLMELGTDYRQTMTDSEAVQVSTEGVDQLEIYFGRYVPQFFYSMLAPLTLFIVVSRMSVKTAIVLFLCVPLIPAAIVAVQKIAKKLLSKYWGTYTELGSSFLEGLQGLNTLKIYQADEAYAEKMDIEAERFRKITMRVLIMQLNSISIMDLVAYGGAALGMILALNELRAGNIFLPECLFIILISAEFFLPMRKLGSFFHIAMNGNAAADKMFRLLDAQVPVRGTEDMDWKEESEICLKDVSFAYEQGNQVLANVSMTVKNHSFTALAGVSGCGKSTIASLLMGELSGYEGQILINGREVRDIDPVQLRRSMTRVKHDSYLFQGTVRENLQMGNPGAAEDEMIQALRLVALWEELEVKGGLELMLTERAANLSGGQRQRLAIARAILHDSDIYIFDEAASNVDAESENKIMEAVMQLAETKTVILISHRLANLLKADQILFLEKGQCLEQGTHRELLDLGGRYCRLYETQRQLERYGKEGVA